MAPVEDPISQCLSLTSNVPNKHCLHAYNWKLGHARSPSVHVLRCSFLVITPSSKLQTPSSLLHCTFIFKKFLFSGIFAPTPLNIIFLSKFPTVVKGWSFGSDSFLHSKFFLMLSSGFSLVSSEISRKLRNKSCAFCCLV